jgi:hypothetical protein
MMATETGFVQMPVAAGFGHKGETATRGGLHIVANIRGSGGRGAEQKCEGEGPVRGDSH